MFSLVEESFNRGLIGMGICESMPGWGEAGERVEIMWGLFYALPLRLHPFTRQVKSPIHNLISFYHPRVLLFVTFYLFFRLPPLAGNELGVVALALAYFLARLPPPAATARSTLSPSHPLFCMQQSSL